MDARGILHFFLINGYGCHLDSPLGRIYLPKMLKFIQKSVPYYVICLGGHTQHKTAPGVSEARLMLTWLLEKSPRSFEKRFLMDEKSFTTLENSRNGVAIIRRLIALTKTKYGDSPPKVVITHGCEAT